MRLSAPRVQPVPPEAWTAEQTDAVASMAGRPVLNIFRTMLRHTDALRAFLGWGSYVMSKRNSLPKREREIVVLRTGFLCRSGYEWTQHREIGARAGLTDAELEAIKRGADAPGWTDADKALLKACDELHADQFVGDPTWRELARHFSEKQCMDVVFTVGQYTQVSMLLNTFGVQLDEGQTLDPDLKTC